MFGQKYTTSLFILLLAITSSASAKSEQYYPIHTWMDDGLIGTQRSISEGPFETRDACEKAMVYKLTKITKEMGATKFEITTREIVNYQSEWENEIVMYILRQDGSVQSQHNCVGLR